MFRRMYRITADREATFEEKTRRLIDLGREHLGLPYGFLTRIERKDDSAIQDAARDQNTTVGKQAGHAPSKETNTEQLGAVQRVLYASGDHPRLQAGETCPLSEAYCRKTVQRKELLSIQNAPAEEWRSDPAYDRFELGSYIGARILVEGELYGTFCFASREGRDRPFTENEEALVELLTRWTSYELERQRSRERIEKFAELVTHDLRNPLNAAQMRLHMARRLLEKSLQAEIPASGASRAEGQEGASYKNEVLHQLDSSGAALKRMEAIIADTLALAHGEQQLGPDDLEPVRLRSIAEACRQQVGSGEATFQVEENAPEEPFLAHDGRLRQLLENLFRNAIDHVGEDVSVTVGRTNGGFFVADDGSGIPPSKRGKIFETSYSTREGGTGLGLSIVRAVAEAHGWSLSVTESASGGARFDITGVERAGP